MTSRERILTAINHHEPERVPLGFDAHAGIYEQLFRHFGVQDKAALFAAMGIDGFSVFEASYVYPVYRGPAPLVIEDGSQSDFFGIVNQKYMPLAAAESLAELGQYRWPRAEWFDCGTVKERCLRIKANDMVTVGGEGGCGIQHAINLRGYEQALADPLLDPDFTHAYLEGMGDFFVEWNERWLSAAAGEFDIFRCGDEVGSNLRMHCSPQVWREFYKPQLKRIFAVAKKYGLKIWFHCCGMVAPILPDLLEIGIDMWDPAPPSVAGNDLAWLKREYGKDLTFVGGVNHPDILVRGTPAAVEAEVKQRIDELAPGGGYILGPGQVLTEDIPLANILAMYETAREYGRY